jgi:hypothetical protein
MQVEVGHLVAEHHVVDARGAGDASDQTRCALGVGHEARCDVGRERLEVLGVVVEDQDAAAGEARVAEHAQGGGREPGDGRLDGEAAGSAGTGEVRHRAQA